MAKKGLEGLRTSRTIRTGPQLFWAWSVWAIESIFYDQLLVRKEDAARPQVVGVLKGVLCFKHLTKMGYSLMQLQEVIDLFLKIFLF